MNNKNILTGEWRACLDVDSDTWRVYSDNGLVAVCGVGNSPFAEGNANMLAASKEMAEALKDMLSGWSYIREVHGELYGVGWDRCEDKAIKALKKADPRLRWDGETWPPPVGSYLKCGPYDQAEVVAVRDGVVIGWDAGSQFAGVLCRNHCRKIEQ